MNSSNHLTIFTDGGARGNPGPAAIGVVIKNDRGDTLYRFGKCIGTATNNVAEYAAVIAALEWLKKDRSIARSLDRSIAFFLDSLLVVNQLNGLYKIKNSKLRELLFSIRQLENEIGVKINYCHIPRSQNKEADALVNQSLDSLT